MARLFQPLFQPLFRVIPQSWDTARDTGVGVSLASLFANGEDGFLFGPFTDFTRLFLLSTGSTGNVAVDTDPVGLNLDRHSWGNGVSLTTILAAQPELFTPGSSVDASVPSGTSSESPPGTITVTGDGTNQGRRDLSFTTVVGRTYVLRADISVGQSVVSIGTAQGGTSIASSQIIGNAGTSARWYFVATSTTTWVRFLRAVASSSVAANVSVKLVPGNHALQATTTKRPLWKANSGKPYLAPDGTDDCLVSPFIPTAALTFALACRPISGGPIAMGGGTSTGNKRAYIGFDGNGFLTVGWGTAIGQGSIDRRNTDLTVVVTGDATGRDVYVDGVLQSFTSPTGAPDGTGGGFALGAYNANGTPTSFSDAHDYAAMAMNRRATPAEIIGNITPNFRSAYQ